MKIHWTLLILVLSVAFFGSEVEAGFGTLTAVQKAADELDQDLPADAAPATACSAAQLTEYESSMSSTLALSPLTDFTLLLESADGRTYAYSEGTSTAGTAFESASTSKLVASVVILSLVERGFLTLDTRPQDNNLVSWWTPASTNPVSGVTLRHLLSFRSGMMTTPSGFLVCLATQNYETCVQNIYNANLENNIAPGSQFFYSNTHLQIAGLMAIKARQAQPDGVSYSSWTAVFNEFKSRTGLFANSQFNLPNSNNPRLAGGMTWTAQDYQDFLEALYRGQILTPALRAELWANQRGSAVVPADPQASPLLSELGEDWRYGLGNWIECAPGTSCVTNGRNSSPGAYGAYPFLDFTNGYFGLLARQDSLGSFPDGVNLFRSIQTTAARWSTRSCP